MPCRLCGNSCPTPLPPQAAHLACKVAVNDEVVEGGAGRVAAARLLELPHVPRLLLLCHADERVRQVAESGHTRPAADRLDHSCRPAACRQRRRQLGGRGVAGGFEAAPQAPHLHIARQLRSWEVAGSWVGDGAGGQGGKFKRAACAGERRSVSPAAHAHLGGRGAAGLQQEPQVPLHQKGVFSVQRASRQREGREFELLPQGGQGAGRLCGRPAPRNAVCLRLRPGRGQTLTSNSNTSSSRPFAVMSPSQGQWRASCRENVVSGPQMEQAERKYFGRSE